jgi:hypothetical protein
MGLSSALAEFLTGFPLPTGVARNWQGKSALRTSLWPPHQSTSVGTAEPSTTGPRRSAGHSIAGRSSAARPAPSATRWSTSARPQKRFSLQDAYGSKRWTCRDFRRSNVRYAGLSGLTSNSSPLPSLTQLRHGARLVVCYFSLAPGRKVLGFNHAQDVFSAGSNATTRVHHPFGQRCGRMANFGARGPRQDSESRGPVFRISRSFDL